MFVILSQNSYWIYSNSETTNIYNLQMTSSLFHVLLIIARLHFLLLFITDDLKNILIFYDHFLWLLFPFIIFWLEILKIFFLFISSADISF